ncbi:MAG TPA: hypothetical protein V6D12_21495 [Candidatus Obscuribacterales bacterium]
MGLMSRIFGGKLAVNNDAGGNISGHNINKSSALAPTGKGVPSPHNADFSSIRSAPVVEKPTYFDARQAAVLAALAKEKKALAKTTVEAYRALKEVDSSDTTVHCTHRKYQKLLAENEIQKLRSNTKLAEALHGMRPEYETMSQKVEQANHAANASIDAIRASFGG